MFCVYLVRPADGDVSVDGDKHGDPDGGGLRDERDRQNVDEHELVERAQSDVVAVDARVVDERRQEVERECRHDQHVVDHRQRLRTTFSSLDIASVPRHQFPHSILARIRADAHDLLRTSSQ